MNKHAPNHEEAPDSELDLEQLSGVSTSGLGPWMNPDISKEERFAQYKKFVDQKLEDIGAAYKRADCPTLRRVIIEDPDAEAYMREAAKLAKMDADLFIGQLASKTAFVDAVVGCISVNGQELNTLLLEGLSGESYVKKLGYRVATPKENLAYANALLATEDGGTISEAGKKALKLYRDRHVGDTEGGLNVYCDRGKWVLHWCGTPHAYRFLPEGALLVRPSARNASQS